MRYVVNPPNPWLTHSVEWIGEPPAAKIEVFEETETRTIISSNDSPDVAFDHSINCYRGCVHGCTYCFSRPTHEYLDFGAGTDFERKIVVKVRAPELLRKELMKPSWKGDEIVFSFTSDPYVPLEANYKLTRACLEVCAEFRNPVGIVTKSALIRRDIDVLQKLTREASLGVYFSIPFDDYDIARALEPFAPSPNARFRGDERAGRCGHPGGDRDRAHDAGAHNRHTSAVTAREVLAARPRPSSTCCGCRAASRPYFEQRLREKLPTKADRILNRIREARGGKLNSSKFGERMRGKGQYWQLRKKLFNVYAKTTRI